MTGRTRLDFGGNPDRVMVRVVVTAALTDVCCK